ncbi:hypothetical protein RJ639_008842 [Escallonia herrerae]|uniref:Transposase (putative) gypsy type domain-containing protein n=1 Tax=Escallonia herrerae TaxID=1293975 RepID=A0AA89ART7_9ASTE|nr:hypothetical protein RJ639_008842 [Escallonia herrerae]
MNLFGHCSARPRSLCSGRVFGHDSVRTEVFGHGHSARAECSDATLFGQNSARPLSLCSGRVFGRDSVRTRSLCTGRVFGRDSVRTEFCSAVVTLLRQSVRTRFCSDTVTLHGQSVRTRLCSDRILLGRCHSAKAECSDEILFGHGHSARAECSDATLFGQSSARPLSLCSGRVFGRDSVRTRSLCTGRVFGRDSVRTEFCSAVVTLLRQSVRTRFCSDTVTLHWESVRTRLCSDRILLGRCHSARAECSDEVLFGQNSARPLSLCSGRVFGRDSVRPLPSFPPRVFFSIDVFERELRIFKFPYFSACDTCVADEPLRFPRNGYMRFLYKKTTFSSFFLHSNSLEAHYSSSKSSCFLLSVQHFELFLVWVESMSETSTSVSSSDESSSSSSSERVPTSGSEVGTSTPQLPLASTSHPFQPSFSQPLPPSSSRPSHSLSRKNALGDVKDQADDKANPKPWYTADDKSGKMTTEELQDLIREYPLPEGWYARLPGLQEPANYGTKFETGIYEEQVKSGYRLPLHPFALRFFEHYRMAPGQLVPNGWRKLADLIYLVQTLGYKPNAIDFMRVFFEMCFVKGVANCPGWYYIHSRQRLLKGGPKSNKGWHSRYFFVGRLDRGELPFDRDWNPFCKDFENPGKPTPNNLTKHILSHSKLRGGLCIDEPLSEEQLEWAKIISPKPIPAGLQIPSPPPAILSMSPAETVPRWLAEVENRLKEVFLAFFRKLRGSVSIDDDPIFRPRWTLRCDDLGMPDSHVSEQHLLHGILPRDKEVFQTQTHETFACSFAQAVYTMYASGSEMLSRFEMARQVAAEEAQQKREAVKEAQEASHRAEELSKHEADHLAQIATLEKRLERVKRKAAEEVTKARDQGIRDFLDGNAGDEWLKKRTDDGLEIYELGFAKAKEMFVERYPDISLDDFVLPAVISPSGETVLPSEIGDAAASHPPGEGPSGDAPEP